MVKFKISRISRKATLNYPYNKCCSICCTPFVKFKLDYKLYIIKNVPFRHDRFSVYYPEFNTVTCSAQCTNMFILQKM